MHRKETENAFARWCRRIGSIIGAMAIAACAPGGRLFTPGPRPVELAGAWIDSAATTAHDSIVWILAPNGDDRMLALSVRPDSSGRETIHRDEKSAGFWYLQGALTDTAGRVICYKKRARNGGTCVHFTLDSIRLANGMQRRRLTVRDFPGAAGLPPRVFLAQATAASRP